VDFVWILGEGSYSARG